MGMSGYRYGLGGTVRYGGRQLRVVPVCGIPEPYRYGCVDLKWRRRAASALGSIAFRTEFGLERPVPGHGAATVHLRYRTVGSWHV